MRKFQGFRYREQVAYTAAFGTTQNQSQYEVKQDRGCVRGIRILAINNNADTNALTTINISANGIEIARNINLLTQSETYQLQCGEILPVNVPAGSTIDIQTTNGSGGTDSKFVVEYLYEGKYSERDYENC